MAGENRKHASRDWLKDAIFFVITVVAAYGYILLMLLIFSFFTAYYIKLSFEKMLIISAVGTVLVAVWYIIKMVKKYRPKRDSHS